MFVTSLRVQFYSMLSIQLFYIYLLSILDPIILHPTVISKLSVDTMDSFIGSSSLPSNLDEDRALVWFASGSDCITGTGETPWVSYAATWKPSLYDLIIYTEYRFLRLRIGV